MMVEIEGKEIELKEIKQLYPAGIVKTGYEDETTQVSLEWLEVEAKGKVEIVGYKIFLELKNGDKFEFKYDTKESLFKSIDNIGRGLKR